jgi:hypothetical protein
MPIESVDMFTIVKVPEHPSVLQVEPIYAEVRPWIVETEATCVVIIPVWTMWKIG